MTIKRKQTSMSKDGQELVVEEKSVKKNWKKVVYNKDGTVDIRGVVVMRMGKTKYAAQQIDPNYTLEGFDRNRFYEVSKLAKHFYKKDVLKEWEGKPVISTNKWPCPSEDDIFVCGDHKRHHVIGTVSNVRVVGKEMLCDFHITRPWSYCQSVSLDKRNTIAAAYRVEYKMIDGKDVAFVQQKVKPSHFFMADHGLPGMDFPIPQFDRSFKAEKFKKVVIPFVDSQVKPLIEPRVDDVPPIYEKPVVAPKCECECESNDEPFNHDIFATKALQDTYYELLKMAQMKPLLTKEAEAEYKRMMKSAKSRFDRFYDKKTHECKGCPCYPMGCFTCYGGMTTKGWVPEAKKEVK